MSCFNVAISGACSFSVDSSPAASSRAAAALQDCGHKFAYVNVLADPEIFENLPRFADWPTFPQVYIDGELIGGCDIVTEMSESGEPQQLLA